MPKRSEHLLLTGHTRPVLFVVIGKNRKCPYTIRVINYGLTISIKKVISYYSTSKLKDELTFIFVLLEKGSDKKNKALNMNNFNKSDQHRVHKLT